MRDLLGRLGGFSLTVILNALVSVVTIPFLINFAGEAQWAAVAVGQSLGSLLSVFALLGWALTGPTEVAQTDPKDRGVRYLESFLIRGAFSLGLCLFALGVSHWVGSVSPWATWFSACSLVAMGVGATWFYVGEGTPMRLLMLDTIPRGIGAVVASWAVVSTGSAVIYGAIVLGGTLLGVGLSATDILMRHPGGKPFQTRSPLLVVREQSHAIATGALTAVYQSAPVLILQVIAGPLVPMFALLDKIRAQGLTAYRPVAQALQGWVPSARGDLDVARRSQRVVVGACAVGTAGCVAATLLMPLLVALLSAGNMGITVLESLPAGLTVGSAIISMTVGPACLVPLGSQRAILRSAIAGAVVTGVALPLFARMGLVGALYGVALGQTSVVIVQLVAVRDRLRHRYYE